MHHGRNYRWILLFHEFKFKVIVLPGHKSVEPDNLSRIQIGEEPLSIDNDLPDAHLFRVEAVPAKLVDNIQFSIFIGWKIPK